MACHIAEKRKKNQYKKLKAMKTKIYTLIALFALSTGSIFAVEGKNFVMPTTIQAADGTDVKVSADAIISKLAPVTPKDADFEDPELVFQISIAAITPVTPKETDFEEIDFDSSISAATLAPVTPSEADFIQ